MNPENQTRGNARPLPDAVELTALIARLGLDKDPRVTGLISAYALNQNQTRLKQLLRIIQPYILRESLAPDPFRPYPTDEISGPVKLGLCNETGAVFGLYPEELMQGLLIAGRPGAGKTTICYRIIEEANRMDIK